MHIAATIPLEELYKFKVKGLDERRIIKYSKYATPQ